jgi:arylsulfatase A-like enzyme
MKHAVLFLSVWSCVAVPTAGAAGARPNVVVLVSDDHTFDALGCAGNPTIKTPNLDRLAASGVRFTRAFSPNPICTPARASILTGQGTETNGVTFFGKPIPASTPLWPELLRKAGYETFYTGKWHNNGAPWDRGFSDGEAIFLGGMSDHNRVPVRSFGGTNRRTGQAFSSELFADAAVEFLGRDHGDRPFCLYVAFTAPHDPRTPPGRYATMYDPAAILLRPNLMPSPPVELFISGIRDEKLLPFPRTPSDVRRELALYYGMISHLDAQVGRILDALEARGLSDNTVVVFVGDQGLSLGAHGVVGKQTLYEEGIRTPLIVRNPAVHRGAPTSDALVSVVDLFPTLCEAAGAAVPPGVEGKSLWGLYRGDGGPVHPEIFALYHNLQRAVRTPSHKLILHLRSGAVELFDLRTDPYELTNLVGRPETAAVQAELTARLNAWRDAHGHAAEGRAANE